jgi:hypothetical protein
MGGARQPDRSTGSSCRRQQSDIDDCQFPLSARGVLPGGTWVQAHIRPKPQRRQGAHRGLDLRGCLGNAMIATFDDRLAAAARERRIPVLGRKSSLGWQPPV